MARRKTRTLTELELEIMQIVWRDEEATVEDIQRAFKELGKSLALSTIRTMLGILLNKGYVARRADGRRFVYRARVAREKAHENILRYVVEHVFDGSALDMVAALIGTRLVSKKDIGEAKRLLREAEGRKKK